MRPIMEENIMATESMLFMRPLFVCLVVLAGFGTTSLSQVLAADGDNIGDTQMCVPLQQIGDRRVIDDRTIVLKMVVGPSYKRIDLARDCSGLKAQGGFMSATSISKLCKQDILRVTQETIGSQCVIEQIVTIDETEAKALLAKRRK
jgi:hypothetical protein